MTTDELFTQLKTRVAGNREKTGFEFTFGMPETESRHITGPSRMNARILAELEYILAVSHANQDTGMDLIRDTIASLLGTLDEEHVLTDSVCRRAEERLLPLSELARSYRLILSGHAHIDMNWMWSYQETVATTLSTFRSICNIMDEYPDFTFTQSQASVYQIVERYDPELMERMLHYIREGRWEVVATNWVEPDKNMPSGESLLRHIQYTRDYLQGTWGVKDFDVDFVPDTFGHAATVPEIDAFGDVRYMYHCRGNARPELLYRYRAPSGKEILVLRESNWYNAAVTPQMASGLMEVVRLSSGLRCGMAFYGVGDHGGGPTRRDVERALDMMAWPIYPEIRFGGIRDYFREAEKIRDRLPVVDSELNFIFPGCYTTQSRIKRANRRAEAALYDTEALASLAGTLTPFRLNEPQMREAWQNVLFTHFHDILTGSCVQDTREHAMGLFQQTACVTNTQLEKAMLKLAGNIDTASLPVLASVGNWEKPVAARYSSQSEGAGGGDGIEHFTGVPATERGSGLLRVYHAYNTLPCEREAVCELTVWDYTGDLRRVHLQAPDGTEIPFQLLDHELQRYWDHRYFRILARLTLPALGYTTLVLRQKEQERYPVYLQNSREQVGPVYDDLVLDNGLTQARISGASGTLISLVDLSSGTELIQPSQSASLMYLETERRTSNAWNVGRTLSALPIDRCTELTQVHSGALRQSVKAVFTLKGENHLPDRFEIVYTLDAASPALKMEITADWQESGTETVPVLTFRCPVKDYTGNCRCLVPMGSVVRPAMNNDVPAIGSALAIRENGPSLLLASDSKYGYRSDTALSLTLINSAVYPDPYPERGVHHITLWLSPLSDPGTQQPFTDTLLHPVYTQAGNVHPGSLPAASGLLSCLSSSAAVTAVLPSPEGILVRGYETRGKEADVSLRLTTTVKGAYLSDLLGTRNTELAHEDHMVTFRVPASSIWEVHIML